MSYDIGRVYRIICIPEPKIQYIGCTYSSLKQKWYHHKKLFNNWLENDNNEIEIYKYFEKYSLNNFKMVLIKEYLVYRSHKHDFTHLQAKKQLWINKLNCLNEKDSFTTELVDNKIVYKTFQFNKSGLQDYHKNYNVKYYQENSVTILKNQKIKTTCKICNSIVRRDKLRRHERTKKHLKNLFFITRTRENNT